MELARYFTEQWGIPEIAVSLMTGIGAMLFFVLLLGLVYIVFTLVVVQWWWRALYFSGVLVYYQYRVRGEMYWLSKSYLVRYPYTWGMRFVLGRLFSPCKMIGLSSSKLEMPELCFNFRGYWPRHVVGQNLQQFIDNGWKKPVECSVKEQRGEE